MFEPGRAAVRQVYVRLRLYADLGSGRKYLGNVHSLPPTSGYILKAFAVSCSDMPMTWLLQKPPGYMSITSHEHCKQEYNISAQTKWLTRVQKSEDVPCLKHPNWEATLNACRVHRHTQPKMYEPSARFCMSHQSSIYNVKRYPNYPYLQNRYLIFKSDSV